MRRLHFYLMSKDMALQHSRGTNNPTLTQLVQHDEGAVRAVAHHHAHVVHLQREGALGLGGHVVAGRAQEVVVVPETATTVRQVTF
jgi:hypothetical protein